MRPTTKKGVAYVSRHGQLLLLNGVTDEETVESVRQSLISEHGLAVKRFRAEAEDTVWDEILHLIENGAQGLAYSLLIEKGIIQTARSKQNNENV
jgi:hypothetical protein